MLRCRVELESACFFQNPISKQLIDLIVDLTQIISTKTRLQFFRPHPGLSSVFNSRPAMIIPFGSARVREFSLHTFLYPICTCVGDPLRGHQYELQSSVLECLKGAPVFQIIQPPISPLPVSTVSSPCFSCSSFIKNSPLLISD